MLVPGDLGFLGLVLVFVVLFLCGPVVSFLIQWRWKVVEERKEEIMRLVAMASEEAQRAELESANVVECLGAFGGARGFQCAMCYCPTTTRCSRCKVVRYCSGKCQIIHWRKGHKEECRPPSTTIWSNARERDFDQEVSLQEGQHQFHVMDLENEGGDWYPEPIETFSVASFPSEFSNPSLSAGKEIDTFVTTNESLLDGHVIPCTLKKSKRSLLNTAAPYVVETTYDVYDTSSPPSEFTGSVSSVDTIPFSSNLKSKTPRRKPRANDCGPGSSSGSSINDLEDCTVSESMHSSNFKDAFPDTIVFKNGVCDNSETIDGAHDILYDSGSRLRVPFNGSQCASTSSLPPLRPQIHEYDDAYPTNFENEMTSSGVAPSNHVVPPAFAAKNLPVRCSGHPAATDNHHSNASQPSKSKGRRALSSTASEDHPCSITRRHSVSSPKLFNSSEIASSLSNPSNSLKTTVQKVVQQFRVPKLSKHYSNGVGCEATGKMNYKMLFPYELFITLCNWEKMELHPCGFTNCGNTCYANAVLQCLAFTQPLTAYLLQGMHSKACTRREWCFTCEFEGLILNASKGVSPLSPIGIVSKIQSMGSNLSHGKEEDAHEFLRCAIDSMQSVCLKEAGVNALNPLAEETTLIGLIFGGYLRSKIKCMKCHGKSEQHERMMDLTVEIQGDIVTLEEALGRFTATEILDGENKYQCSRCKSYERAKKKLTVLEAPNVLTIAFKRFQSGKFGKLNKSVRFPETLNLAPYMSVKSEKSPLYKLYAVVVHLDVMNSAFSGHYVCYVKNIQGKWFKADDSRVRPVELDRVLSKGAYMLLYSRCSPQAPGLVRNVNMLSGIKSMREKSTEAISNSYNGKDATSSARPGLNAVPSYDHSTQRAENYSHWKPDGLSTFESLDSYRRYHPVGRIPRVNSLSDNSSLFSCSDEASCSTESTRDSVSTDDFSEYVFGDSQCCWNSPMRIPDDTYGHALHSRESRRYPSPYKIDQVVEENPQFLFSDTANYGRKLKNPTSIIGSSSSRSSETNSDQLGWGNPFDMKSGASLRRSTWERAAQTFY